MATPVLVPSGQRRVIIHHLSDLQFQPGGGSGTPLIRYKGYLDQLEPTQRPNLIVITGNLTSAGTANALLTVAEMLLGFFPLWLGELSRHIFIVPGPRDVNWEGK
jgi:hypothetical protein